MRVDLDVFAAQLGVSVDRYPFASEISGLFWSLKGRPVLAVNSNHSETEQLLALAHQLGHYILGHQVGRVCGRSFSSDEPEELAADRYAAELLNLIDQASGG